MLGSFQHEAVAIEMYKMHWLHIEQAAAAASVRSQRSNAAEVLEGMFQRFLKSQPEALGPSSKVASLQLSAVGGQLYSRFRKWLAAALVADASVVEGESDADALDRKTAAILRRLETFAVEHFATSSAQVGGSAGDLYGARRQLQPLGA